MHPCSYRAPRTAWQHRGALVLLAAALLLFSPARPAGAKPSTLYISTPLIEADPLAVCNDGSSQQYYFKEATHAKMATVWLVYLAPGLWCWNATSCALRLQNSPWDAGSSKWPATRKRTCALLLLLLLPCVLTARALLSILCTVGGVFDDDPYRNPLAGANLAYVGYCTSDAYAGDTGATSATAGLAFRGGHTVQAILTSLARVHGLGTTGTPEQVILAGCAAGGRGVLYNIDYAGQYVARSVTVRALIDSAIWLDVPPLSGASGMTLQEETAQMLAFTNASGRLSPGCAAQYTGDDAWRCLYGQYRLPFVKVPYFVAQAQFDKCVSVLGGRVSAISPLMLFPIPQSPQLPAAPVRGLPPALLRGASRHLRGSLWRHGARCIPLHCPPPPPPQSLILLLPTLDGDVHERLPHGRPALQWGLRARLLHQLHVNFFTLLQDGRLLIHRLKSHPHACSTGHHLASAGHDVQHRPACLAVGPPDAACGGAVFCRHPCP